MVLKRKLPTAMASGETKKEGATASTPAATPEVPKASKAPIAPEPQMETSASAIPDIRNDKTPVASEGQKTALPDNDFTADKMAESSEDKSAPAGSWDEEPEASSGWEIDGIGATSKDDDVFGSMVEDVKSEEKSSDPLPPWQQGAKGGSAPELPSDIAAAGPQLNPLSGERSGPFGALIGIVLLIAIGFGAYTFFFDKNETTEVISRWTGSLNEVSEEIPTGLDMAVKGSQETDTLLKPETVISMAEQQEVIVDEEDDLLMEDEIEAEVMAETTKTTSPFETVKSTASNEDKTIVEFVDVSENEVEKPLTAEGAGVMPEEVGMIVELQQAISEARKDKDPDNYKEKEAVVKLPTSEAEALEMLTPDELDVRNRELSRQLDEELAEYRKILAGDSSDGPRKVKPSEFFVEDLPINADDPTNATLKGSIPLPQRSSTLLSQKQAESLYGANPYNLPVVPEPSQRKTLSVRTLSDFDVSMFQVERERVRIPKDVKPSFRASNFPAIVLLSTVKERGIIAEIHDKQGVLLIGESVAGWELISVKLDYAEFSNGKRKHIVNIGR
ncbi:MAG: hypothetical protein ACI9TY_000389 [Alphaproteobacteria bacterium]|jgi:hypothetical protein